MCVARGRDVGRSAQGPGTPIAMPRPHLDSLHGSESALYQKMSLAPQAGRIRRDTPLSRRAGAPAEDDEE